MVNAGDDVRVMIIDDHQVVSLGVRSALLDAGAAMRGRAVLTLRGRLMADTVTRALTQ